MKIVSVLQRLHSEIWRTISDVQKRDEQTDRQTDKKLNVLATPAAGEIRDPHAFINLSMQPVVLIAKVSTLNAEKMK